MTQSTTSDPWAAAQSAGAQQQNAAPQAGQQESPLAGAFAPSGQGTALFGQGSLAPSLFNKTHFLGTERRGRIVKAPYEQQGRDFNTKLPKFWSQSKKDGKAVTTDAVDHLTGQPNRPVMDVMVELETEYGPLSAQECMAVGRDPNTQTGDSKRVFAVSGKDSLTKFREAIAKFNQANPGALKSEADLVGKLLTVKRVGQVPNPGGNPSWVHEITISV